MLISSPLSTGGVRLFKEPFSNEETGCSLVCCSLGCHRPYKPYKMQHTMNNDVTSHTCCCCSCCGCCCLFFSLRVDQAVDRAGQQRWTPSAVLADADPHSSKTCEAASSCLPHPCMHIWHVSPALSGLVADEACAGLHSFRSHPGRAGQGRAGQGRAGQGRAGQGRAGQNRAGQDRTGQCRLWQGNVGQTGAGQDSTGAGQGRLGQGRVDWSRAGQVAAGQPRPGQGRAGQHGLPRPEHVWSNDGLRHNFILLSIMAMPCDISQSN